MINLSHRFRFMRSRLPLPASCPIHGWKSCISIESTVALSHRYTISSGQVQFTMLQFSNTIVDYVAKTRIGIVYTGMVTQEEQLVIGLKGVPPGITMTDQQQLYLQDRTTNFLVHQTLGRSNSMLLGTRILEQRVPNLNSSRRLRKLQEGPTVVESDWIEVKCNIMAMHPVPYVGESPYLGLILGALRISRQDYKQHLLEGLTEAGVTVGGLEYFAGISQTTAYLPEDGASSSSSSSVDGAPQSDSVLGLESTPFYLVGAAVVVVVLAVFIWRCCFGVVRPSGQMSARTSTLLRSPSFSGGLSSDLRRNSVTKARGLGSKASELYTSAKTALSDSFRSSSQDTRPSSSSSSATRGGPGVETDGLNQKKGSTHTAKTAVMDQHSDHSLSSGSSRARRAKAARPAKPREAIVGNQSASAKQNHPTQITPISIKKKSFSRSESDQNLKSSRKSPQRMGPTHEQHQTVSPTKRSKSEVMGDRSGSSSSSSSSKSSRRKVQRDDNLRTMSSPAGAIREGTVAPKSVKGGAEDQSVGPASGPRRLAPTTTTGMGDGSGRSVKSSSSSSRRVVAVRKTQGSPKEPRPSSSNPGRVVRQLKSGPPKRPPPITVVQGSQTKRIDPTKPTNKPPPTPEGLTTTTTTSAQRTGGAAVVVVVVKTKSQSHVAPARASSRENQPKREGGGSGSRRRLPPVRRAASDGGLGVGSDIGSRVALLQRLRQQQQKTATTSLGQSRAMSESMLSRAAATLDPPGARLMRGGQKQRPIIGRHHHQQLLQQQLTVAQRQQLGLQQLQRQLYQQQRQQQQQDYRSVTPGRKVRFDVPQQASQRTATTTTTSTNTTERSPTRGRSPTQRKDSTNAATPIRIRAPAHR